MYVYLIKNTENSVYKIGKSKNPTMRIKMLQTGNDSELAIIHIFKSKNASILENTLHNIFGYGRKRGEWFNMYLEDELKFIELCEKFEKNINLLSKNDTGIF
jgi:hypothetical protein